MENKWKDTDNYEDQLNWQETDPKAHVDPDWVEMGQDEEVLGHADKTPENLKTVKEEDVSNFILVTS